MSLTIFALHYYKCQQELCWCRFGSFNKNFRKFSFDDFLLFLYLIIYERKTHVGVVEVEVKGHTPHDDQTH